MGRYNRVRHRVRTKLLSKKHVKDARKGLIKKAEKIREHRVLRRERKVRTGRYMKHYIRKAMRMGSKHVKDENLARSLYRADPRYQRKQEKLKRAFNHPTSSTARVVMRAHRRQRIVNQHKSLVLQKELSRFPTH